MEGISKNPDQVKEELKIPEALSGQETAKIVEDLFERCPIALSSSLVESNVVLTIAGIKSFTNCDPYIVSKQNLEDFRRGVNEINQYFQERSLPVSFKLIDETDFSSSENINRISIMILNLVGFERATKRSKIPGVSVYEASSGPEGFNRFWGDFEERIKRAKEEGKISKDLNDDILSQGIYLGYPDQAILDYSDWYTKKKDPYEIRDANIPYSRTYQCAEPNFDYYKEHENDPDIRQYIEEAGTALRDFYESDWHKRIAEGDSFISERARQAEIHKKDMDKKFGSA